MRDDESKHWTETERDGGATSIRSFDVRWILMVAGRRPRRRSWWERLLLRWHRLKAARITN